MSSSSSAPPPPPLPPPSRSFTNFIGSSHCCGPPSARLPPPPPPHPRLARIWIVLLLFVQTTIALTELSAFFDVANESPNEQQLHQFASLLLLPYSMSIYFGLLAIEPSRSNIPDASFALMVFGLLIRLCVHVEVFDSFLDRISSLPLIVFLLVQRYTLRNRRRQVLSGCHVQSRLLTSLL